MRFFKSFSAFPKRLFPRVCLPGRRALLGLGIWAIGTLMWSSGCHSRQSTSESASHSSLINPNIAVPAFDADSAYAYVARQVQFGPRIPGTPAHAACADWLIAHMKNWADTVYVQQTTLTAWNHEKLPCVNIIASFNPAAKERLLLLAHWDTRPWADQDPNPANRKKPFPGADDGASGVAVLLETARQLHAQKPDIGIDLFLTDCEDYGNDSVAHSFCLGTQYWAQHPHVPGYVADYGVLLDMVGGKNAHFYMEGQSQQFAGPQQTLFWNLANALGYSDFFRYDKINVTIEDDHQYVSQMAHIPCFDVIHLRDNPKNPFPPYWHTLQDNLDNIDRATLKAVGQTVLQLIYTHPAY
ncbi:MAG: M28 family peptidase [Thermoflavifilum aggregans]|nr:M28 family peptidase [Thermoflavifilum aggregans]